MVAVSSPSLLASVSLYSSATTSRTPIGDVALGYFLHAIETGVYRDQVAQVRESADKDEQRELKARILPGVSLAGVFRPTRWAGNLLLPSRFLPVDLDDVDPDEVKESCRTIPHVLRAFTSVGGHGVKVIVGCAAPLPYTRSSWWADHHYELWQQAAALFSDRYTVDESGSDVTRLVLASDDSSPYTNPAWTPLVWRRPRRAVVSSTPVADHPAKRTHVPAPSIHTFGAHAMLPTGDPMDALARLEEDGYGKDKKKVMAVIRCLKGNGHQFADFAKSYSKGGGTCGNDKLFELWEAMRGDDADYRVIFGMAKSLNG